MWAEKQNWAFPWEPGSEFEMFVEGRMQADRLFGQRTFHQRGRKPPGLDSWSFWDYEERLASMMFLLNVS